MVPAGQASTSAGGPAMGGTLPPAGFRGYPVTQPLPRPSGPYERPPVPITVGNNAVFVQRMMGQPMQLPHPQPPQQVQPMSFQGPHPPRPVFQPVAVPQTMILPMPQYIQPGPVQQPQGSFAAAIPQHRPPFAGYATANPITIMQHPSFPAVLPAPMPGVLPVLQPPSSPQPSPHSPPQSQQPNARPRSTEFPGPRALQVNGMDVVLTSGGNGTGRRVPMRGWGRGLILFMLYVETCVPVGTLLSLNVNVKARW
jgi:hypothetical protein